MTKPIVSVACMQMYEEGRFLLTDPLHLYLGPAWKKQNMKVYKEGLGDPYASSTVPCERTITIKHILMHTSGLSYGFDRTGTYNKVDGIYHREKYLPRADQTLAEWVDRLATAPLSFQPGGAFHYGFNSDVVGRLVEVLSGKPLDAYLQEHHSIVGARGVLQSTAWHRPSDGTSPRGGAGAHLRTARHGGHVLRRRGGQAVALLLAVPPARVERAISCSRAPSLLTRRLTVRISLQVDARGRRGVDGAGAGRVATEGRVSSHTTPCPNPAHLALVGAGCARSTTSLPTAGARVVAAAWRTLHSRTCALPCRIAAWWGCRSRYTAANRFLSGGGGLA